MTNEAMSPLRRRMIEDMTIRNFGPKTHHDYIRSVKNLAMFLGRWPDTASNEDVRRFQLRLSSDGISAASMNNTVAGLRFFFRVTLGRADIANHLPFVRQPRKLPVVLSPEEVSRFLEAAPSLKYKAAFSVAYGAGLRASEVTSLKPTDIDSKRMVIRVEQGIRRFLSHVLPHGFHRIRHYGLFASAGRAENIARARQLLHVPKPRSNPTDADTIDESQTLSHPCPCCGGRMTIIETFERGSAPHYRPAAPTVAVRIDTS